MPPYPQIDGYRITRLIGQGGMAHVYAAIEAELEREVAIKVVSLDPNRDTEIVSRLEFEARSLARLRHPHIVELYRFGRLSNSALYYVMPLLTGGDLGHWLKPVTESKVTALMRDLLDALGHAHQAGIVHRDVKPENILFDQHGRVQLADFGAAFALESTSRTTNRLTQEGFAVGSLGYMSPEQARGQGVSGLSDLYSLAVVAFELLTDSRCHSGEDAVAIALAQIEQPPAQLPNSLAHWQAFFARALNPDPHQRYPTAAAMKAALPGIQASNAPEQSRMLGVNPTSKTRIMPITQTSAVRKRFKTAVLIAFLSAISLGGLAWYAWNENQQHVQFELLQSQLMQAPENAAIELLSRHSDGLTKVQTSALATEVMQRMAQTIQGLALSEGNASANLNAIAAPWAALDSLRRKYQLINPPELAELEANLTRRVEETLILASEQFDRETAQQVLPLAQALSSTQAKLAEVIQRAADIPDIGGEFTDASGIRMRLVALPDGKAPGMAIMASALTSNEFDRYATALKLRPSACKQTSDSRGCMNQKQANAIADWYSTQSDAAFTVPNASEWQKVHALAPRLADKFAASRECRVVTQSQRPSVVKRTWGNIKSVFGGEKAQASTTRECNGELVFALDGSGKSTVASSEKTVLVLVKTLR